MSLQIGDPCPQFCLPNQHGEIVNIADIIGKQNIVLFFYPKDDTPGCTKEACSFRDNTDRFLALECQVIGISSDSISSHKRFSEKHQLNYTLLSDHRKVVRNAFGVPKSLFGLLPGRVTYIIDKQGIIRGIYNSQTQPLEHIQEAIACLRSL
jgi:peroxiredoxin Q/BCP